jgi:hypothetical protein
MKTTLTIGGETVRFSTIATAFSEGVGSAKVKLLDIEPGNHSLFCDRLESTTAVATLENARILGRTWAATRDRIRELATPPEPTEFWNEMGAYQVIGGALFYALESPCMLKQILSVGWYANSRRG